MMKSSLSASEYQEIGKRHYKQKEYQKAIEAFTEGIQTSNAPQINLLDLRAGTYLKIENLDSALRDAKRMIQVDKRNVKGYLRTGQVLQRKKLPDVALDIYKYGSKVVPITDPDYTLLKGMRDKLERQLSPPKSIDPLTVLPVELAEMVLSYLTFKDRVNSLRVSPNWYTFISSRENLWTEIDLSQARKKLVPSKFLRKCMDRAHGKISSIILHRVADQDALRVIATRCSKFHHLQLLSGNAGESLLEAVMCAKNLRALILSTQVDVTLDAVTQILHRRPTLETLECHSLTGGQTTAEWNEDYPRLTRLLLHTDHALREIQIERLSLQSLFSHARSIQFLSLRRFSGRFPSTSEAFSSLPLTELRLSRLRVPTAIPIPSSIRTIVLNHISKISTDPAQNDLDLDLFHLPESGVPHLRELEISNFGSYDDSIDNLNEMLSGRVTGEIQWAAPSLRRFSLQDSFAGARAHTDVSFTNLIALLQRPSMAGVEELELASANVGDPFVGVFPTLFKRLRRLDLSRTSITGVAVKALVEGCKELRWLGLEECTQISPDAVEWARAKGESRGLRIVYQFGRKTHGSGRRLRESY